MSRVLAFDFGASTGRAILGEYENERLSYREIHRFDNELVTENGKLCWNFPYLLSEVKRQSKWQMMLSRLLLTLGELTTV